MKPREITDYLTQASTRLYGKPLSALTEKQLYRTLCTTLRELLRGLYWKQAASQADKKQVCYFSMEFLTGPCLRNHLYHLGLESSVRTALRDAGHDLDRLYALDPDPGLGNGGLGRLAACYLDALTTGNYAATGYCILYEFGIFRQKLADGWQMEFPDDWRELGDVWLTCREDDRVLVRFGGHTVQSLENGRLRVRLEGGTAVLAVPWDLMISGYHTNTVNRLVLWSTRSPEGLDLNAFTRGEYAKALEQTDAAEVLTKVLYPADHHEAGKRLRLRQQYLLVSASLQSILARQLDQWGTLDTLPEKYALHINDTHPALCVPELMRLLIDCYDYDWDPAWSLCQRTMSYTNHTVMPEALEHWDCGLFSQELPRVYEIVCEIDRRLRQQLSQTPGLKPEQVERIACISRGQVCMENLCLAACHKINGVSQLHTKILTSELFCEAYRLDPQRFCSITNGIAYRRWLCQADPRLSRLITDLIGDGFQHDSRELENLMQYHGNTRVLDDLARVKRRNKRDLAELIARESGIAVDPDSLFDVQIKRLHEYKRQLLNVLHILHLYLQLKEHPGTDLQPRTFVFAAKASPGYGMAKQIIRLIDAVSRLLEADPAVRDRLRVVFLENYRVSLAEKIIPAAEVSEQISVAGKEASGTGNMKLMLCGALTLGTLDGANVEISRQVGEENLFLFGLNADQTRELWKQGYDPAAMLQRSESLQQVLSLLEQGWQGLQFDEVLNSLRPKPRGGGDPYLCLADYPSYELAQARVSEAYQDPLGWNDRVLTNIAHAGIFSADRAVEEYAKQVWGLKP